MGGLASFFCAVVPSSLFFLPAASDAPRWAALTINPIQQRDDRVVHRGPNRETGPRAHRTDGDWVKVAIDAWTFAAGLVDGHVFRPVNRGDIVQGAAMSEKVVWQMLREYATDAGVPGIAPHDCRRYAESRTMPNQNANHMVAGP